MTDDEIYEYLGQVFEWNKAKAAGNYWNHGVRFTEAATVFFDPFAIAEPDPDHSEEEQHLLVIGRSAVEHMLVVVHVYRASVRVSLARGGRRQRKGDSMKSEDTDMRPEYDFSKGVKGVFLQDFRDLRLVSIAPELREAFPDSASVNDALREVLARRKQEASAQGFAKAS